MKAGTTWLYAQLRNHPDIYFTPEKEIHYFANKQGIENQLSHMHRCEKFKDVVNGFDKENIAENMLAEIDRVAWYADFAKPKDIFDEWYVSLFRFNYHRKYGADFSNLSCQMDAESWSHVHSLSKNLKVIYILRDPIARLWSHYKFHMKWVDREMDVLDAGFDGFRKTIDSSWFWANAEYARNYRTMKDNLREDEFLLLYSESFRQEPLAVLDRIYDFLEIENIEPNQEELNKNINETYNFKLPDEWMNFLRDKLGGEIDSIKSYGIWHPDWTEL